MLQKLFSKFFISWYALICVFLFLYSYTQVDLNLTLSRVTIWQTIQRFFQHIGYFERPLSTALYVTLLAMFFSLYGLTLWYIKKKNMARRELWNIIAVVTLILVASYPAFSYDFFNYMFTAKTVLVYHQNPYTVIPLQFTGVEPWLTFMRWTHLPSAYTPLWILLTLPPYLLGFGYFLLILWNIKALVAGFYLLTVLAIGKTLDVVDKKHATLGMAIFALNPLVIIETLVSGHNDIVMMAFIMLAFYFAYSERHASAWIFFMLSIATKLMTIFLLPITIFRWKRTHALALIFLGLLLVLTQREVLPWYFVWIMPFVALIPERAELTVLASGISLGLLLRYVPYLYLGNWDPPAPNMKTWLTWGSISAVVVGLFIYKVIKRNLRFFS